MKTKGQFMIIAALLVSVVLVASVLATYSIIRSNPIREQPPIQSAIDETNFAIKQILCFTVGYYGSVLKVTGNSSYAKMLATNYLRSGLDNIANIHPEWATSLDLHSSDFYTYWYTNTSSSSGNLTVAYNLTGLGISGVNYAASCKLEVFITNTTSNQAYLKVNKDEGEPMINLGKRNFKFFRYETLNSTWELIDPSSDPIVYSSGTYQIGAPTGVEANCFLIQVEDPRGIIVVASSYSMHTYDLAWPSPALTTATNQYLDNSIPDVDSSPDKGTHSNFTAQQYGPDSVYDTLTEKNTAGNYELDLEAQWKNVNYTNPDSKYICIKTGTLASENLRVDVWNGGIWTNVLSSLTANSWNNVSVSNYVKSSTFTMRFKGSIETGDAVQSSWQIDATILCLGDARSLSSTRDTITVELLQNGSMIWLGQNLELTTQAKPIPPLPVRSLHLNQTENGVNREVPFQVEDWGSDYQIPLGLTANQSVFGGRTKLVFLANNNISKAILWWNGSDQAVQPSYAYVNKYFTGDDVSTNKLTNGILTIQFGTNFVLNSSVGTSSCTATFMRVNNENSITGSSVPSYAITKGIVRDVIHQEPEFSGGVNDCPNFYAHIVITLPANVTYYTFALRMMFVDSNQNRNITDLCPIELQTSISQIQTENGTMNGYPIVSNGTGLFYNFSTQIWAHHWSQFISGTKGAGIMFTDKTNQQLYALDSIAGKKTGCLETDLTSHTIEFLPVKIAPANFTNAFDITWYGAVTTFANTNPIYKETNGEIGGSWITVEYPPTITVS